MRQAAFNPADAVEIAAAVRAGRLKAGDVVRTALERIRRDDPAIGAFTRVLDDRAMAEAEAVDLTVAAGGDPGALAGVTFAAKDLFDVAGLPTTAGAAARRDTPPAASDAAAITRLLAAGAVLVGTLNMDEFAYGFATENAHYGTTRNPHDRGRIAGGSSGGSAAAVAAGMVSLSLGSDTNGSIRVPASLCGVYGLRPSHGAVPTDGVFPFVESLDVPGPFAPSLESLRLAFSVLSGRSTSSTAALRVGRLDGWFRHASDPEALAAIDGAQDAFGELPLVSLPWAEAARSAAFLLTASEGGRRHLPGLRTDPMAFDPAVRDRLLAGLALPAAAVAEAEAVRDRIVPAWLEIFEAYDVLLAPATPCVAPAIGQAMIEIDGRPMNARANLGLYTQPLSLAGLPVLTAPLRRPGRLPLGLQLVAAPAREAALFAAAARLDAAGVTGITHPEPTR
ncbi:AtzE family amidohydrolase [Phenylobacterium sp. VNQ135]|uniref:AtzE family amidohydrolase n=1 Tax=Phenylobacterium sp. VNQ135 TaxID=3400922 RepID=UPI003C122E41